MMRQICLFALFALTASVAVANSQQIECPKNLVPPPAISATGPYQVQGFGQQTATAVGVPSCAVAIVHLELLIQATKQGVVYAIKAMPDGTYTVHIEPM